jgi:putative addiction module component (TIGR02574 family)
MLTIDEILEAARKLPLSEQIQLADRLEAEIPEAIPHSIAEADGVTGEGLLAELQRRWEDYESGRTKALPADEVIAELRRRQAAGL